jgi:hypothetical protein
MDERGRADDKTNRAFSTTGILIAAVRALEVSSTPFPLPVPGIGESAGVWEAIAIS